MARTPFSVVTSTHLFKYQLFIRFSSGTANEIKTLHFTELAHIVEGIYKQHCQDIIRLRIYGFLPLCEPS